MVGLLVYAAKGRKPAAVGLASPRPFLVHGKRQGTCKRQWGVSLCLTAPRKSLQLVMEKRKSAMMIELPEKLEAALKIQANAHGVSPAGYVCEVLERDLASSLEGQSSGVPFKTGRGMFAKYGQAPSAEEIDANRTDMFQNFGEHF
jgi:plasmid stability protein